MEFCFDCTSLPPFVKKNQIRSQRFSFFESWPLDKTVSSILKPIPWAPAFSHVIDYYGVDRHRINHYYTPLPGGIPCFCTTRVQVTSWANSALIGKYPIINTNSIPVVIIPVASSWGTDDNGLPMLPPNVNSAFEGNFDIVHAPNVRPSPQGDSLKWGYTVNCGPGCGEVGLPCGRSDAYGLEQFPMGVMAETRNP